MTVELLLLSAYSLGLLGIAAALRALGRRSTSPWASRTLAGHLRATGTRPEPLTDDDWPHSEVRQLYAGMSLVAVLASVLLSIGSLTLHHDGPGIALPLGVLALSAHSLRRACTSFMARPTR